MIKIKNTYIQILFTWLLFSLPLILTAQLTVSPASYQFPARQAGSVSEEVIFTIENAGTEAKAISPEEIQVVSQNGKSTPISIMTYNIWNDNQNWPARLAHMLSEIRELNPDLIGLQEVIQRSSLPNQAQTLADSLGYYYYFSSVDPVTSAQRFGNAILSRYPILETNWRHLQPINDYRLAVHAKIEIAGNIIDYYNTHLHNTAVNAQIREQQITDLYDFIDDTSTSDYIFVTGDYNANPDWDEMNLMYQDFYDVYTLFHEDHLEPEHSTLNFNWGHQQRRIDYIFFNKKAEDMLIPLSAEVVLDQPAENGIYGSDHFGVLATFNLLSNSDAFLLRNIEGPLSLQPGENTSIGLIFAPFVVDQHQVNLQIPGVSVPVSGESFDATIHQYPWEEDFSSTQTGEFPLGWETNTENWQVSPSENAGSTAPELAFVNTTQQEGVFWIKSPFLNTTGLDSMNLSFRHLPVLDAEPGNFKLKLMVYSAQQEYQVMEWLNPDPIAAEDVMVQINSDLHGIGSGIVQLVWMVEGLESPGVSWFIDDVILTAEPALSISPASFSFGPQLVNTVSEQQVFTLTNIGGGILQIAPEDISLAGNDSNHFSMQNISNPVSLGYMETAEILLVFQPSAIGFKSTSILLPGHQVDIDGLAYDPTITQMPWNEDFSGLTGGTIPLGWTTNVVNWGAFNGNNAGGEAPEMVFWWQPETAGTFTLTTPKIETQPFDTLILSFKHRINDFGPPGQFTLKVLAITPEATHILQQWQNPGYTDPAVFTTLLTDDQGLGSNDFQLQWVFEGTTDNITQWDIDDILLKEPGSIAQSEILPTSFDFGQQVTGTQSQPATFTVRNIAGGILRLTDSDITIEGADASSFILGLPEEGIELSTFQTAEFTVSFVPESPGAKSAIVSTPNHQISLTGLGVDVEYFIYSDFSVEENGIPFTNVGGYREVPGWASSSINATDVTGEGDFGNTILRLNYDLDQTSDFTAYWMWAFPQTNISVYTHMVVRIKASEPIAQLKIELFDTEGVSGNDGASYTLISIDENWKTIMIPVDEFQLMSWASNQPDMSKIQKINFVFEKNTTTPAQASIDVDLVGFSQQGVSVSEVIPSDVNIYPNPAHDKVFVKTTPGSFVNIFDITGTRVKSEITTDSVTSVDVSDFAPGIYLVEIRTDQKAELKKLIIN
jgi:endonuclease/exonuclease/phosphatase family metal-dependent hydrolase